MKSKLVTTLAGLLLSSQTQAQQCIIYPDQEVRISDVIAVVNMALLDCGFGCFDRGDCKHACVELTQLELNGTTYYCAESMCAPTIAAQERCTRILVHNNRCTIGATHGD